jgi:hypothetical protein
MRRALLGRDLTELRANLRRDLRAHQLTRDQRDRLAHGILKPTIPNLGNDIGNRHPLLFEHRGVSFSQLCGGANEHERHGGRNHDALVTPLLPP